MAKEPQSRAPLADYLLGFEKIRLFPNFAKRISRLRHFNEEQFNTVGSKLPRLLRRNPILRLLSSLSNALISGAANVYGTFLLSFGLATLLLHFAFYFIRSETESPTFALIAGACCSLLSIPFLTSSLPIGTLLQKSETFDRLIFDFLRFRHPNDTEDGKGIPLPVALGFGILLAVIGFLLPLKDVLLVLVGGICICLAVSSPEFSFLLMFLLTPLYSLLPNPKLFLAAMILVTFLSYFGKTLRGKRMLYISLYDKILLWTASVLLICGLVQKGSYSFLSMLLLCIVLLSHLLASNLFINPTICRSAVILLLLSSLPIAVYGITDYFSDIAHGVVYDGQMSDFFLPAFAQATGAARADATFASPDLYAAYLVVCIVFSFSQYKKSKNDSSLSGIFYMIALAVNMSALLCTYSHEAWLSLLLGYFAYRILKSRRINRLCVLFLLAVPIAFLLIPASAYNTLQASPVLSFVSFAPILQEKEASLSVLSQLTERLLFGVGRLNFASDFPKDCSGVLVLVKSVGILATIPVFLLLLARICHLQRFNRFILSSSVCPTVLLSSAALFSLSVLIIGCDLFADPVLVYLFCTILGMGNAALRLSKEEMYEKSFYDMDNSDDTAEIEISVEEDG